MAKACMFAEGRLQSLEENVLNPTGRFGWVSTQGVPYLASELTQMAMSVKFNSCPMQHYLIDIPHVVQILQRR